MSKAWLQAAREIPGLEIVGLVDRHEDSAKKRRQEFDLSMAMTGTRVGPVLKATRPDMVFDCTVPGAHVKVTLEALKAGCHVLGEKPLAESMKHAKEMLAAAKKARKIYAVIQNRRYDPSIRAFRKFLGSGILGKLNTLYSDFFIGAHFGGFRDQMKHVLLLDMAIHTFDAARFIASADPLSVYCHEFNPQGSWYKHGASAIAIFEMSGGLTYSYRGSWCAEGLNRSWECDWRAQAEKGSAIWDGNNAFKAEIVEKTDGFISEMKNQAIEVDPNEKHGGHAGIIAEFVNCVRKRKVPETVCTDNIKSLAMVFSAIESAKSGKRVRIKV